MLPHPNPLTPLPIQDAASRRRTPGPASLPRPGRWPLAVPAALLLLSHQASAQSNVAGPGGGFGGRALDGLLPNVGPDMRVGDLRPQLEQFIQPGPTLVSRPAWIIQPAIEVAVGVTDNALRTDQQRRADVFTVISPQIVVSGDTPRATVNLSYAPQITEYASSGSQNQISHFFNGQALFTVVPDAVYVDVHGIVTQQSLTGGGYNQVQTQSYNRQNDVQTISFGVSPYVVHRFGGWGTGRLTYSLDQTYQSRQNGQNQGFGNQGFGNQLYGTLGNLTTEREIATFSTGENLGRFNDTITAQSVQYDGPQSYRGAYRNEIQNQVAYALTRSVTLLGSFGYQSLRYGGVPGVRIDQPTYDVGARYAPNPDTSITVEYGRYDGSSSIYVDGHFAPTARTRVIARYSTGITTDLEQSQNLLNSSTVGATGLLTDNTTGAPVNSNSSFSGLQNGVYRVHRFSGTVLFLKERDSFAVDVTNEQRTSLASATALIGGGTIPAGTSTDSTFVGASWQHELAPDMTSTLAVQYGLTNSTSQLLGLGNQQQGTLSLTAAVTRQFTETLSGAVRFTHTEQTGGQAIAFNGLNLGNYTSNVLLLSLRKSF